MEPTDLIDVYLSQPVGTSFNDYLNQWEKSLIPNAKHILLNKFGLFWIGNDGNLYYYTSQGNLLVQKIDVSKNNKLITRINGRIIPIISLQQLRILLNCLMPNTVYSQKYQPLLNKLNSHRSDLEDNVEQLRRTF